MLKTFFTRMSKAVLEVGQLARENQGKVKNIGKIAEKMPGDSEKQSRDRSTKTIIDEQVQEILLQAAIDVLDPQAISLDAEEDTPLVKLFSKKSHPTSLVLDPIDGTFEYLGGKDSYSICVALVEKGNIKISIVYFPSRDDFYFLSSNSKSYLVNNAIKKGLKNVKLIKGTKAKNKTIYKNNRTPESVVKKLKEKGYQVFDDTHKAIGVADVLVGIMNGEILAYLAYTRQMRDMLLGPIVAGAGGYAVDWGGKQLAWPQGGRVPRAMFGVGNPLAIL